LAVKGWEEFFREYKIKVSLIATNFFKFQNTLFTIPPLLLCLSTFLPIFFFNLKKTLKTLISSQSICKNPKKHVINGSNHKKKKLRPRYHSMGNRIHTPSITNPSPHNQQNPYQPSRPVIKRQPSFQKNPSSPSNRCRHRRRFGF